MASQMQKKGKFKLHWQKPQKTLRVEAHVRLLQNMPLW